MDDARSTTSNASATTSSAMTYVMSHDEEHPDFAEVDGEQGWGDWSSTFASLPTFDVNALRETISAKATEAYNELNSIDVRAIADTIAERANEAAKELEARADEAFGAGGTMTMERTKGIDKRETDEGDDGGERSIGQARASRGKVVVVGTMVERANEIPASPENREIASLEAEEDENDEDVGPDVDGTRLKAALKELKMVKKQLAAREDEIARRAAQRASLDAEQDAELERAALAEQQLAEAQARVSALTKECRELKKVTDSHFSADILVKEKDEIIKEVMAEGEALSKKQAEMEGTIKKLRKELRERDEEKSAVDGEVRNKGALIEKLSAELRLVREDFANTKAQLNAQLEEQKEYYLSKLALAKEELTEAEVKANVTRNEELTSEVKILRERERGLKDQLAELQHSLQRSSAALERQEERFKNDLKAIEERAQTAESSHDELLRRMPESTRPLLRQIESLQLQATENLDAWAAAEKVANARFAEVQERAESALAREAAALDEKEVALRERQSIKDQSDRLKGEIEMLKRELETQRERMASESEKLTKYAESFAEQEGRMAAIETESQERESKVKQMLAQERGKHKQLGEAWDRERAELLASVAQLENSVKTAQDGLAALKFERIDADGYSSSKFAQAPALLTGGEAGLSLAVRDTLAQFKSQLAARTTELEIAQDQIKKLEQTRESLANELLNSEKLTDSGVGDAAAVSALRARLQVLERRYDAALEVIGERDEECEEMLDRIQAMRSMLDTQATQIHDQTKTIEALRTN